MLNRGTTADICKSIFFKTIILAVLEAIIMIIFTSNWKDWVTGLLFGTIFGILNFRLLAVTLEKSVDKSPSKAQSYVMSRYFIRYILTAVVLFIGFKADYMEVVAVIVGILSIKIVIFVDNLYKLN